MTDQVATIISSTFVSGEASEAMEHYEAIEMQASERYLLDELTPELRDAYEEHMFGCTDCANDVRFGAAFVDHAKAVLPGMASIQQPRHEPVKLLPVSRDWFAWLRPAFMVPAFACLLAIVGYQNLVVYPALQASASEPRLLPPATVLQGQTRSSVPVIYVDPVGGATVSIPLPQNSSQADKYASYKFDVYDSKNKLTWTQLMSVTTTSEDTATLWLPARIRKDSYKLTLTGVTSDGRDVPVGDQFFDLHTSK